MEETLMRLEQELKTSKEELHALKDSQNPIRKALKLQVSKLEQNVANIKEKLTTLKTQFTQQVKNALHVIKEKGISVTDAAVSFLKLEPVVYSLQKDIENSLKSCEKTLELASSQSQRFHKATAHLKNAGRVIIGKEANVQAAPNGKIHRAIRAPLLAQKNFLEGMQGQTQKLLQNFAILHKCAEKTSFRSSLHEKKEEVQPSKGQQTQPSSTKHQESR